MHLSHSNYILRRWHVCHVEVWPTLPRGQIIQHRRGRTGLHASQGIAGHLRASQGIAGHLRASQGIAWHRRASQDIPGLAGHYKASQGITGHHRESQGITGHHRALTIQVYVCAELHPDIAAHHDSLVSSILIAGSVAEESPGES